MKIHALWLTASVLALTWGGAAAAQTTASAPAANQQDKSQPQEVVVTGERRATNLQTTAIAATVLTGSDLQKKGVFTVDQLQFVSPSITVNNFGQGNDIDIRGIGKGEHNTQTGTGVVTIRDGVATFPGYIQEEPYYDIASVEVLRGPQGTFSGQNATGGAVIVNTNDPKINGGYSGYLLGHYGNYNDYGVQGAVNLPIDDTLAARAAFYTQHRSSFYNISGPWTGDPNLNWVGGRFSLLWTPTPSVKVLWKTDADYLQNGGYFGDPLTSPSKSTLFNFSNNYHTDATDALLRSTLKIDYVDQGTGITFRSISSYAQGRTEWIGDIDGTASNLPGQSNFAINEAVDERMYSQEFNIISPDHRPITWILGGFYQNNKYTFPPGRFDIAVPPGAVDEELEGTNPTHTSAIFGQVSFNLPHGFQIQAGARYSDWSTTNHVRYFVPEFTALGIDFHQNETETGSNFTGKLTLNWEVDPNNFLYAFVASGAKPGGLNTALYFNGGVVPPPFKQEYVTDYEAGWKTKLFDNHLRLQLGAFYNSFEHFQVIIPIPNQPTATTEMNVPNPTKLYGVEASAQLYWNDWTITSGLGLQKSELGTFYSEDPRLPTSGTCNLTSGPATATCVNLAGKSQTYAPDFTFNAAVQYNYHLKNGDVLTPSANYSHISEQWATMFENRAAGDYLGPRDIFGASLAWTHGDFVTTLYGYNIFNDKYVAAALSPIRLAGAPRQFGISVMKVF